MMITITYTTEIKSKAVNKSNDFSLYDSELYYPTVAVPKYLYKVSKNLLKYRPSKSNEFLF